MDHTTALTPVLTRGDAHGTGPELSTVAAFPTPEDVARFGLEPA